MKRNFLSARGAFPISYDFVYNTALGRHCRWKDLVLIDFWLLCARARTHTSCMISYTYIMSELSVKNAVDCCTLTCNESARDRCGASDCAL